MAELRVDNIHVHYGKICALHNVSFSASIGKVIALVGKNGAGKSTLLKSICGLVGTSEGAITWNDQPILEIANRIAYLPQREDVDWNFPITVRGVVEMGRFPYVGWFKRFRDHDDQVVEDALVKMDLLKLQHRQISALSGGQQQRTFIARAIAQEAEIFLFDEAYNGLDRPSQAKLAEVLKALASGNRLVLVSHHDIHTVPTYFDQALLLNNALIGFGDVDAVMNAEHLEKAFA